MTKTERKRELKTITLLCLRLYNTKNYVSEEDRKQIWFEKGQNKKNKVKETDAKLLREEEMLSKKEGARCQIDSYSWLLKVVSAHQRRLLSV